MLVAFIVDVEMLHEHVHAFLSAALSPDVQVDAVRLPLLLPIVLRVDLAREVYDLVGAGDVGLVEVHLIFPKQAFLLRVLLVLLRV